MVPLDIADKTGAESDADPSTMTVCLQFVKKSMTCPRTLSLIS